MPSRRRSIAMSDAEVDEYLHGRRTMNVASIGPDGCVHLVAMWYGFTAARGEGGPLGDRAPAFWTYGR
ncbi:MAG: hypothetical protein QOD30_2073, partial [Actinomycetota bacterium]|nr:hypothetical protein [Actinomycetota bacterium]